MDLSWWGEVYFFSPSDHSKNSLNVYYFLYYRPVELLHLDNLLLFVKVS